MTTLLTHLVDVWRCRCLLDDECNGERQQGGMAWRGVGIMGLCVCNWPSQNSRAV